MNQREVRLRYWVDRITDDDTYDGSIDIAVDVEVANTIKKLLNNAFIAPSKFVLKSPAKTVCGYCNNEGGKPACIKCAKVMS